MDILVVGGGIGGMSAAIKLSEGGHQVTLVDIDPDWRVYGAGITITGPTLRAYRRLGLLDEIKAHGAITNGARVYRFDGVFLQEFDEPVLEEGLPATGGIMRPVLHQIMQKRVATAGIPVQLGVTVEALDQVDDGVTVTFNNGTSGRFDLVVGADGIMSKVRELAFEDPAPMVETGQACWRVSTRRPAGFDRGEFYFGGPNPAGITACSPDDVYLWMLTPHEEGFWMPDDEVHVRLKDLLKDFGGTVGWIRDTMGLDTWVNYRPLAVALQNGPWFRGRAVLLGDAAHATTPHLASGAGMAVEDALVLAEELGAPGREIADSLAAYSARREPRCRDVVETSVAVGKLQLTHGAPDEIASKISRAVHALAEEY